MKKENVLLLVLAVLFVILALITLMTVFLRNNASLLRHKLKIGALIISIQALIFGCGSPQDIDDTVTCYVKPFEPDEMSLVCDHNNNGVYIFDLDENNVLQVNVSNRQSSSFCYAIFDTNGKQIICSAPLNPKDLDLNNEWEELTALIDISTPPGTYDLYTYNMETDSVTPSSAYQSVYRIRITEH